MIAFIALALLAVTSAKPTGEIYDPMINDGLFEGDIMGIDPDADKNAVARDSMRWAQGIIPYVIDVSRIDLKDGIFKAFNHIQNNSCITFVERTTEKHYIRIFKGNGCYSYWGFINRGQQDVSLGRGCESFGTTVHELMHAIGFTHEHSRSDRDDYLNILWDNIPEAKYHNFRKLLPAQNRLFTKFDFASIMLYGQHTFSISPNKKSMEAKDGRFMPKVNQKNGLSASDIKRLNLLYQCNKKS